MPEANHDDLWIRGRADSIPILDNCLELFFSKRLPNWDPTLDPVVSLSVGVSENFTVTILRGVITRRGHDGAYISVGEVPCPSFALPFQPTAIIRSVTK